MFLSAEETFMPETCKISGVSRRTVLFAAAGAAPFVALMGGEAQAKVSQKTVQYQATPKDGHQCDCCAQFVAPKACKVVDGDIAPTGWCALWVKKPA
jgi:hypothetical protein